MAFQSVVVMAVVLVVELDELWDPPSVAELVVRSVPQLVASSVVAMAAVWAAELVPHSVAVSVVPLVVELVVV